MTLREAFLYGCAQLEQRGVPDGRTDAWYLLEYVTGRSRNDYYVHGEEPVSREWEEQYRQLLEKRGSRVPLQYLTGEQEFMGLSFRVRPGVLIPRQDTEILTERVLKDLRPGMRILDLCTGSGCILISLLKKCPGVRGVGADKEEAALLTAKENAARHQVEAAFVKSDMFMEIGPEPFDCIVSNPPYIASGEIPGLMEEVRDFEPRIALDGGADGLDFYRILAAEAGSRLKDGGGLYLEIGAEQGAAVTELLRRAGFSHVTITKDYAGKDRVVCGKKER